MAFPFLLTLLVTLGSFILAMLTIWRVNAYIQIYRFDRVHYKPLFGVVGLRLLLLFYFLLTLLLAGFSIGVLIY